MKNLTQIFGSMVFNDAIMKDRLPLATYNALKKCVERGEHLDLTVASVVANAMKDWAIELGATHYTHWFHPLTGITAEKHDSFIEPTGDGRIIMEFSGKELIKGEPDASSFPNGGLRATFEARGYTAWDPSSPAFVKDTTLYIPTVFCSYTGEVLDKKIPLLRSVEALEKAATRLVRLFPQYADVKRVTPTVGPEQEYFLIDKDLYEKRKDLQHCGRTLFGAAPPRGQGMTYHYFGAIKPRVAEYMKDLDDELWKLGILSKTKHNEAAPAQHELAPIFDTTNIATDHNQLIMDTMKRIAAKHNMVCLLHEKPFEWVNGSGKHNNWSLITDTGANLFRPGNEPYENKPFLLFLVGVLRAVDQYQDLLRISVANAGNDHRLGGCEAPPAIISVYVGDDLAGVLEAIETGRIYKPHQQRKQMAFGIDVIPEFTRDTTDRNRTSPFAFTGNKFEFRMCGSSASIAGPNMIINTAVADVFSDFAERLERARDFDKAVNSLIKKTYLQHKRIVFNGNNYAEGWVVEANRRGLSNYRTAPEAFEHYTDDANVALFERHKVLTRKEVQMRLEIKVESYCKTIEIEARTLLDIYFKEIVPAVLRYQDVLSQTIRHKTQADAGVSVALERAILVKLAALSDASYDVATKLEDRVQAALNLKDMSVRSKFYAVQVLDGMNSLRTWLDAMEVIVGQDYWPVPTYEKLLFSIND